MDYISDSDGSNTLSPLSPSAVDTDLLRDVYSIYSESTKRRLQLEALNTPFARLYEDLEAGHLNPEINPTNEVDDDDDLADVSLMEIDQRDGSATIVEHEIESATTVDQEPSELHRRSLRKRTFASRHPYIADQADWLGICSVDSLNEMFTGEDDLPNVMKVLNRLYLKRKSRYRDEERFKAQNFYAHLGKSKIAALQGDADLLLSDLLQEPLSTPTDEQAEEQLDYVPDEDDEQLIPYDGLEDITLRPKMYISLDDSSESDESESEEEQLIKIGGRYRKLSKILRGVLPESARRLGVFQEAPKARKKRTNKRAEPRKGLGVKKRGTLSAQNAELEKELLSTVAAETYEEISETDHRYIQPELRFRLESPTPPVVYVSSSSDYGSDSVEELFSDTNENNSSFGLDSRGDIYFDSGTAQEGDNLNYLLSTERKKRSKTKRSKKKSGNYPRQTQNRPRSKKSSIHKRKQDSSWNRPAYGTLKRRKLTQPRLAPPKSSSRSISGAFPGEAIKKPVTNDTHVRRVERATSNVKNGTLDNYAPAREQPFRRDPIVTTTAFEAESTSSFLRKRNVHYSIVPKEFAPSRNSLFGLEGDFLSCALMGIPDFSRLHSIGDGHIFFPGQDGVTFMLVGQRYSLQLFQLDVSLEKSTKALAHLRKLLQSQKTLLNVDVAEEITNAIKSLLRWLLIVRQRPSEIFWKQLSLILDDFSKLQTKKMRSVQSIFHSQMLFMYYICVQLEVSVTTHREPNLHEELHKYCSDYWLIFFQTFDASELSEQFSVTSKNSYANSICLMYTIWSQLKDLWWPAIIDALQEIMPVSGTKTQLMEVCYFLSSMVPRSKHNWMPFIVVLNKFRTDQGEEVHHQFIDVCEFACNRLGWPLEERLVTQLYASITLRKFGNFANENLVPQSVGEIRTRNDIPDSTIFERFLVFLYGYISSLSSRKDVKKLISKLLASSQYIYQKGRRFQIMFVNRLNLIVLLSQVSDIDLKGQLLNLIIQIKNSKDMFIYGRSVDALWIFTDVAKNKGNPVPVSAFQTLFEAFSSCYDSLLGMPALFKKLIECTRDAFGGQENDLQPDVVLFNMLEGVNLQVLPDKLKVDILSLLLSSANRLMKHKSDLQVSQLKVLADYGKTGLSFLNSQMGRLPATSVKQDEIIEEIIERSIHLWNICCIITSTQRWNIMMLQKYPYIGNAALRERFLLYLCNDYLDTGDISNSNLGDIDRMLVGNLASNNNSKYAPSLLSRLSRTKGSVFYTKRPYVPDLVTPIQLQSFKFQIMSNLIQSVSMSSNIPVGEKKSFLRDLITHMRNEYNIQFRVSNSVDFWKRLMEVIHRSAKPLLNEVDEFWEFSEKLGFPNKRTQNAWIIAGDEERLQMLNYEFTSALHYGKDYAVTLDNWLSSDYISFVFQLIQIYVSAILVNDSHWAHIAFLLNYLLLKLETFQIRGSDILFKHFLDMIADIATISQRWNNSTYIMYELQALTYCVRILRQSFYSYDGYKDQKDFVKLAEHFIAAVDTQPPKSFRQRLLLTDLTFGKVRSTSFMPYHPPYQHTTEEYSKAYTEQDQAMVSLNELLKPASDQIRSMSNFDFLF